MTAVLETFGLAKSYRSGSARVDALRGVDLQVPKGVVYGLLGPNGAGKSTLLRIVLGLVRASGGGCQLFGANPDARVRRRVGALIESPALYPFLTATRMIELLAKTSGISAPGAADLLARVGLTEAAHRRVRSFSLGMKQRLAVASALIGKPELLIFDEPTNGLDPGGIQEMRSLMRDLARDGTTVILSSHLMEEVQKTCDRVAILNHGAVVAEGAVPELLAASGALMLRASPIDAALKVLGPRGRLAGDMIAADIPRDASAGVIRELVTAGVDVHEARWSEQSLEDLFLSVTRP